VFAVLYVPYLGDAVADRRHAVQGVAHLSGITVAVTAL
jgi:hypothetical protein